MYHTCGLVLRKDPWREADWIVTALTEDFGKLRFLAQGARRHGAKLRGHLETGTIAVLWFVSGRHGYRLTTSRAEAAFPEIGQSLQRTAAAVQVLTAFDQNLLTDGGPLPAAFTIAREALTAIAGSSPETAAGITLWGHAKLFELLGVLPAADTPEAQHCPTLLSLAARQATDAAGAVPQAIDGRGELAWCAHHLGVRVAPPASFVSPA